MWKPPESPASWPSGFRTITSHAPAAAPRRSNVPWITALETSATAPAAMGGCPARARNRDGVATNRPPVTVTGTADESR